MTHQISLYLRSKYILCTALSVIVYWNARVEALGDTTFPPPGTVAGFLGDSPYRWCFNQSGECTNCYGPQPNHLGASGAGPGGIGGGGVASGGGHAIVAGGGGGILGGPRVRGGLLGLVGFGDDLGGGVGGGVGGGDGGDGDGSCCDSEAYLGSDMGQRNPPPWVSVIETRNTGSLVQNRTHTYTHWADDYRDPSGSDHLTIRRVFRSRNGPVGLVNSSFGPFNSMLYDVKLEFMAFNQLEPSPGTRTHQTNGYLSGNLFEGFDQRFNFNNFLNNNSFTTCVYDTNAPTYAGNSMISNPELLNSSMQPATALTHVVNGVSYYSGEFVDPKYMRFTLVDGRVLLFEGINTDYYPPPNLQQPTSQRKYSHGRLLKYSFASGHSLSFTYQTFTEAQLTADPSLQWKIATISDGLRSISVEYKPTQIAGGWVVSKFTYPGGRTTTYGYNSNYLTSVSHADGSQSTFVYTQDANGLIKLAITDPIAQPEHRTKTIYFSGFVGYNGNDIIVNSWGAVRVVGSGANETKYANFNFSYFPGSNTAMYYEGAGALQAMGNGSDERRYGTTWDATLSGNSVTLTFTGEPTFEKRSPILAAESRDRANFRTRYLYEADSSARKVNPMTFRYYDDNTFEAFCYVDGTKLLKRIRDRQGRVIRCTYDTKERLILREFGLKDNPTNVASIDPYVGLQLNTYNRCATNDIQTPEYATRSYEYYPDGSIAAGLIKSVIDERGNRTDYEYNAGGLPTKIILASDTTGGTRPQTTFGYDSAGRLLTVTDPEGQVVTNTYDVLDRVTKVTYGDGTSNQWIYGNTSNGAKIGLLVKSIDRRGVVTTFDYDAADRLITRVRAAATIDGAGTETATPLVAQTETFTYANGTSKVLEYTVSGTRTSYFYDYRQRVVETRVSPRSGAELVSKTAYRNNLLFYRENPQGCRTYFGYDATDGLLIREVTYTVPGQNLADNAAVLAVVRSSAPNALAIVRDIINNAVGEAEEQFDPLGTSTRTAYDSRGRSTTRTIAFGTTIEAKTETLYDAASNVTEVRTPRYFDTTDVNGSTKAREQWTYTGRNLVATHTDAPGTTEAATESFTYTLSGRRATQVDFRGNTWTTTESGCCAQTRVSIDPLGHGSITNANSKGQVVHTTTVSDAASHSGNYNNPIDAKTLAESTTRYDQRGRPIYQTTWLVARGLVDTANPPVAGLNSVPLADGLTTQYLYDDNLTDGVGLDNATGVSVPKLGTGGTGNATITLATAIAKLADTQANGGAGTTFSAANKTTGRASVSISPEDEVSFTISDSTGRTVMSGKLNNYKGSGPTAANSLAAWSCTLHDATANLVSYGTVLETRSIDALGFANRQWTDGAGRTIQSFDQLDKVTVFTYDATGNPLSVRDPNSTGADMLYDSLGRNIQRTDTFGDIAKTDYDRAGNAIKQTDPKNKFTLISFDARNRRKSTSDRISAATTFTYLPTGHLASLTDGEGQVTSYSYDTRGSKLTEQYPDHTTGSAVGASGYGIVTFFYDNAGRKLRKQDQAGATCTYSYDLAGKMIKRDFRTIANSPSGTIADSDTFAFDRAGRLLTALSGRYTNTVGYTYDLVGRRSSESLTIASQTYTVISDFNTRNELIRHTYPDASIADRAYDARGELSQLKLDNSVINTRTYDNGGRMATEVLGNGITETRAYRTDNLLSTISYSNTNIGNLGYSWDANKNKTAETIGGVMSGYGFNSSGTTYDFEDRLTGYQRASGTFTQAWSLTSVGDWNSVTTNGTAQTRTHGPTHELLTAGGQTVTTDVKGNITVIPASLRESTATTPMNLTYDFDNRLRSADIDNNASVDVSFEYDALGRRVARTQGSTAEVFVHAVKQTVADYPRGGTAATASFRYVFGSYIDEPVLRKTTSAAGTSLFYHRNHQHTVYALSDSTGAITERYAYTAYGQPTFLNASAAVQASSAANNRYTYTSREWDGAIGLHHFRARSISGTTGRFLSRDSIGLRPNDMSLFQYVSSNPLLFVDPSGHKKCNIRAYFGHTDQVIFDAGESKEKKRNCDYYAFLCCNTNKAYRHCSKKSRPIIPGLPYFDEDLYCGNEVVLPGNPTVDEKLPIVFGAIDNQVTNMCDRKQQCKCDKVTFEVNCNKVREGETAPAFVDCIDYWMNQVDTKSVIPFNPCREKSFFFDCSSKKYFKGQEPLGIGPS